MAPDAVLVLDAGTSALRAVLVTADGRTTTIAAHTWPMSTPPDAAPFGREYDPAGVRESIAAIAAAVGRRRERVVAVAVTGQREGLAFAAGNEPVLLSPNIDARASADGIAIDARLAERVYEVTGHLPSLMQAPAKLRWLRTHRPGDAARVDGIMPLADWIAAELTGVRVMSRSLGVETGLLPLAGATLPDDEPFSDVLRFVLPVVSDGVVAGKAHGGALHGVPVVLAGADTQCALAGMGGVGPGDAGVPAGWSAPVQMVLDEPLLDTERRTWTGRHVASGRFVLESNAGETGRAWSWVRDLLGASDADANALATASPVGARDVMVALGPRVMAAHAMTAGVGALAVPLPLVMAAPSHGDVLRATLEGCAFAIRANLEQLEEVSGRRVDLLRVGGGMSRESSPFPEMLAQVLGRPVEVAVSPETSALGAALLAARAVGGPFAGELEEALAQPRRIEPDARVSAAYDDLYDRWCAMADQLALGLL